MEIRIHGRGGQGGVTCAKILAAVHARMGYSVQAFGDYAGERSGAPVRAYTRISREPVTDRNKVYDPDHLLVLDPTLLGKESIVGLAPRGLLLVNQPEPPDTLGKAYRQFRIATVDATDIARRHGIGTRSVVIVNTTIAGAFLRAMGLPFEMFEDVYRALGLLSNVEAAREAYDAVCILEPEGYARPPEKVDAAPPTPAVLPLTEQTESQATPLKTGNWRTQTPHFVKTPAPCNSFCPAGNDVIGFVQQLVREGEPAASVSLGKTTPLAAVCGRVCPAPCMEGCNRVEFDGSVNIRGLERWIADRNPVAWHDVPVQDSPYRVAIVGSGPAGLSAAYSLAQRGHRATIFEGEQELGGVLRTGIPSYRLPRDVLDREVKGIINLGVEARTGEFLDRTRLKQLATDYDAVILATGLQRLRRLDVPGNDLGGVQQGIHFLHSVNLGGERPALGKVVVLGGGNTAMDCARSALRAGASEVTVAYRRSRYEMPAIAEEVEQAEAEGVRFLFLRQPIAYTGSGSIDAIELAEVELGEPDDTGRRRPMVMADKTHRIACDQVLIALGQSADLSLFPEEWTLVDGRIHEGDHCLAVFAAGDVSTGHGTVAHAIGDGRRAADRTVNALGPNVPVFQRPDRSDAVPASEIRLDHFKRSTPSQEVLQEAGVRRENWDEVSAGLANALEAHRCFSCGDCTRCDTCRIYCPEGIIRLDPAGYEVDYSYCKGCGICVGECPRHAMEMSSS